MGSALHVYANLLWRDSKVEARVKRVAALRLLQEPHYRLHLNELSRALVASHGSTISGDLLAPARLAETISADSCFVYSDGTGNVLLDAGFLMTAGKDCLKAQIDRVWYTSSPLSWARNQLAWYIVSRQHIDMRPPDLFLAAVDDAESFLAAAWTSRMDLRDRPDHPYTSLKQLLRGETRLELIPDQSAIRLNFNKLLQQQHHPQTPTPQQLAGGPSADGQEHLRNGHDTAAAAGGGGSVEGAECGSEDGAYREAPADVASAMVAMKRVSLSQRPSFANDGPGFSGHSGNSGGGDGGGNRDTDEHYEEAEEYGDGGEEYDEDDDRENRGHGFHAGGGGSTAVAGASRYTNGGSAAAAASNRPTWPLRPDLLQQYVRAVFAASGSPHDHLMAVMALALVNAGRTGGAGHGGNRGWPLSGAATPDAHRFRLPLNRLVKHVRETAPHLLPPPPNYHAAPPPPAPPPGASSHHSGGGGGWLAGALIQRLRERPSRGCFRVQLPGGGDGAGTAGTWGGEGGHGYGSGGEEVEGAVVSLDLDTLRERVVEALAAAAAAVFSGSRPVDEIRRTAAVHLASRTRPFAGRAHCVRLITLARTLAEELPPEVFDPNRLGGFERLVGSESSNNVMHVFRKAMPGGMAGLSQGHGDGVGTFITLNLGKLLAAAGVRDLDSVVTGGRRGEGGGSGGSWAGRGGGGGSVSEAAPPSPAAAAASRAAALAAASHSGGSRDPPQPQTQGAAFAGGGDSSSSHNSLPPPPSDAALRQAVEAIFLLSEGGRGGGAGAGSTEYASAAVAAKRTAALSLVKALRSQQGGFLPLSRLTDIVSNAVSGTPDLEGLLEADPDLFEIQEPWYGGPRSVRLRAAAILARAAAAATIASGAGDATEATAAAANGGSSHNHSAFASAGTSDVLPRRPNTMNCPYYIRHGTCGYGASCKYNHPPLRSRRSAEHPAPAAAAPTIPAMAPGQGTGGQRVPLSAAAAADYRHPQRQDQQGQGQAQNHHHAAAAAAGQEAGSGGGAAAAAPRLSPSTLEVKIVTTACTPDHLDMLQHCYASPQVAVACKVRHAAYNHHHHSPHHPRQHIGPSSSAVEVGQVCLVQLYAPAVAAVAAATAAARSGGAALVSGSDSSGGSAGVPVGGSAGAGGGGAPAPRWPATVYLVDPAAGEDKKGLLLPSLSPLLEDRAVPKIIYCSSEVVPYMPRIAPLYDISVLHALIARAPHAVLGGPAAAAAAGGGPGEAATVAVPPLANMLQQHGVMTAAGAEVATVAPAHSPLWAARPLGAELRQQAVLEVVHLASLWTGLIARLLALPQELSQKRADCLLLEHSVTGGPGAVPAGSAAAGAASAAGLVRSAAAPRAPSVAAPVGMAVLVPAAPVATPAAAAAAAAQQRNAAGMHRGGW